MEFRRVLFRSGGDGGGGGHGEESSCRRGADRRCLAGQERPVPPRGCAGSPGCGWRVPPRDTCHTAVCPLTVSLVRPLSDGTVMPVGMDNAPRRVDRQGGGEGKSGS